MCISNSHSNSLSTTHNPDANLSRTHSHIENHMHSRKFICKYETCQKEFKTKGNLLSHLRIHVLSYSLTLLIYLLKIIY